MSKTFQTTAHTDFQTKTEPLAIVTDYVRTDRERKTVASLATGEHNEKKQRHFVAVKNSCLVTYTNALQIVNFQEAIRQDGHKTGQNETIFKHSLQPWNINHN